MPKHRDSDSEHSNAKSDAEDSGSEEEYVVEKIVNRRVDKNGKVSFSENFIIPKQHGF